MQRQLMNKKGNNEEINSFTAGVSVDEKSDNGCITLNGNDHGLMFSVSAVAQQIS